MCEQNSMCATHVYPINYCQACHNKKPNTMPLSVSSISGNWVFFILVSSNFLSKPDVAYIPLIHQAPEILKRRQRKIKLRPLQTENVPNWVFYKLTIVTKISIINQLRWAGQGRVQKNGKKYGLLPSPLRTPHSGLTGGCF